MSLQITVTQLKFESAVVIGFGLVTALAHVPQFADTVADRGWRAWWQHDGVSIEFYRTGLEPMLRGVGIPAGFVAHCGERYLGSVLLIESDLEARPNLSPWIAAVWVDPEHRRQGIANDLMVAARAAAATLGHQTVYLCAEEKIASYYLAQGWKQIETDVGGLNVFEMAVG